MAGRRLTLPQKYKKLFVIICLLSCLLWLSCRQTTEPDFTNIELSVERVAAIEVLLKVTRNDTLSRGILEVRRNGETIFTFPAVETEKLTLDQNVVPSQEYCYRVVHLIDNLAVDSSSSIIVTTLGTTSQEFDWNTFIFPGEFNKLWDVWASSPNDVWAVGRITLDPLTTLGNNAVHFDGENWIVTQIGIGEELFAIFGLDFDHIWAAGATGTVYRWDGLRWEEEVCLVQRSGCEFLLGRGVTDLTAIWASSPLNLYLGVERGIVLHFDGEGWRSFPLPSANPVDDIWGIGSETVYVATAAYPSDTRPQLYFRDGNVFRLVELAGFDRGGVQGVWAESKNNIYLAGGDLIRFDGIVWKEIDLPVSSHENSAVRGGSCQ